MPFLALILTRLCRKKMTNFLYGILRRLFAPQTENGAILSNHSVFLIVCGNFSVCDTKNFCFALNFLNVGLGGSNNGLNTFGVI